MHDETGMYSELLQALKQLTIVWVLSRGAFTCVSAVPHCMGELVNNPPGETE